MINMKILAIGDFHGKFSKKLRKIANSDEVDIVVSVGDYCNFSERKEFFKHSYRTGIELWEVIGKKKVKEFTKKNLKSGERVLKELDKLKNPVISVSGNLDYTKWGDAVDYDKAKWKWVEQDFFSKLIKKYNHIKIFDYSFFRFGEYVFIGHPRSTFPGKVKSKAYKKQRKILERLFKKFKKENKDKKLIYVSHNVPYNTKLDKIDIENADEGVNEGHFGSKLSQRLIKKYQPILNIAGHMHENQGKDKIGKTMIINTGAANKGEAAIIDIDDKTKKINKVRFVK